MRLETTLERINEVARLFVDWFETVARRYKVFEVELGILAGLSYYKHIVLKEAERERVLANGR